MHRWKDTINNIFAKIVSVCWRKSTVWNKDWPYLTPRPPSLIYNKKKKKTLFPLLKGTLGNGWSELHMTKVVSLVHDVLYSSDFCKHLLSCEDAFWAWICTSCLSTRTIVSMTTFSGLCHFFYNTFYKSCLAPCCQHCSQAARGAMDWKEKGRWSISKSLTTALISFDITCGVRCCEAS